MPEKVDKPSDFEQIIAQEVNNLGLDEDQIEGSGASGRVSEVVRENAGENIPQSSGNAAQSDDSVKGIISDKVTNMIFGGGQAAKEFVLPTPEKQKLEVKKAIAKRTRDLVEQATKLEKSKHYSAAKMERLLKEIRHMRNLMSQLMDMTRESIEGLYRKFIWRQ